MRGVGSAFFHSSTCWLISCHGSFDVANRWPSSCRGSNHLWEETSALRVMTSSDRRGAAPPARLLHRLPSLNGVVPQHPPPSHRHRRPGRNVAVGPDGDPLRVHRRRVGLEAAKCLLLLPGVETLFTTRPSWRFIKAAVLVGHPSSTCQTE